MCFVDVPFNEIMETPLYCFLFFLLMATAFFHSRTDLWPCSCGFLKYLGVFNPNTCILQTIYNTCTVSRNILYYVKRIFICIFFQKKYAYHTLRKLFNEVFLLHNLVLFNDCFVSYAAYTVFVIIITIQAMIMWNNVTN